MAKKRCRFPAIEMAAPKTTIFPKHRPDYEHFEPRSHHHHERRLQMVRRFQGPEQHRAKRRYQRTSDSLRVVGIRKIKLDKLAQSPGGAPVRPPPGQRYPHSHKTDNYPAK